MKTSSLFGGKSLYPFDRILIGYCLLMTALIALLGRPFGTYTDEIAFYLSMAILAVVTIRYTDPKASRRQAFLRYLYPAIMFTLFYRMTGGQMFLLFDRFFDAQLVAFEKAILGFNPTLYIDQHLLNVFTTELLSLCYFCYYLMLPGFLLAVFFRGDYHVVRESLAAASLIFFVSYLIFWLYPVEGPRWHFMKLFVNQVEGPVFRPLVNLVIDNGAVRGGAMPSSHTGVALATMLFCFRYYRVWGWILAPIVFGLALGTVWGRFHYVSDVIVGAAISVLAVWLVWKFWPEKSDVVKARLNSVS